MEQFLTKVEQGNTDYITLTRACTQMTTKLNETNLQSTDMINKVTHIITDMIKARHPEDMRGGLPSLAESITKAIQELGEQPDDNK